MDQKVLAGVGNVYRAEVLFRAGLDPFRPGTSISEAEFRQLWDDLVAMMAIGVDTGHIHTIRAEHDHGDLPRRGADRPRNYVYQRDGWACRVCGDEIALGVVDGRGGVVVKRARPLSLEGGRLRAREADRDEEFTVLVHRVTLG